MGAFSREQEVSDEQKGGDAARNIHLSAELGRKEGYWEKMQLTCLLLSPNRLLQAQEQRHQTEKHGAAAKKGTR